MFEKWLDPYGLKKLKKLLQAQNAPSLSVVVLTGAGISQESGLATFRGTDGLWENHKISEIATPDGLERNPQLVLDFYNQRRKDLLSEQIKPNAAHTSLAKLEQVIKNMVILTQNIDNLHERGGSGMVLHIHGQLLRNRCGKCKYSWASLDPMALDHECSVCSSKSVRPDVVFFKESPYHMDAAWVELHHTKIFISIGTSGIVYPAAHFVQVAKRQGAICIEINPNAAANSQLFDITIRDSATQAVPKLVDFLIEYQKTKG